MAERAAETTPRRSSISGAVPRAVVPPALALLAGTLALIVAAATPAAQEQAVPSAGLGGDIISLPIAPEGVAFCRWRDLEVTGSEPETPGDLMFALRLARAAAPCALPWQPEVWVVDRDGERHGIRSYPDLYPGRLFLPRGAEAQGGVAVDSACGVPLPLELVVDLPDGPRSVARTVAAPCNGSVGPGVGATDFAWALRR